MDCTPCRPRAVLANEVYEDIKLVDMFAVSVCERKKISSLMRELGDLYPLSGFGHLKRVRTADGDTKILIAPKTIQTIEVFIEELQSRVDCSGMGPVSVVQVSKGKPITRRQFEAAAEYWPTNFHENKRLEKALKGELFPEKELTQMQKFLATAYSVVDHASATFSKEHPVNGAVVVDPLSDTIVAKGAADPAHPLKHAVMVAIDNVAISQGGGAWNQETASLLQKDVLNTGDLSQKKVKATLDAGPKEYTEELTDSEEPPAKRPKKSTQYLCTGYDLYTTNEPCVMCAMALVHSRILRVFYCRENKRDGGLGSKFKIHLQEGLNHHFEVYHVPFKL